jgi:hypothetical protein
MLSSAFGLSLLKESMLSALGDGDRVHIPEALGHRAAIEALAGAIDAEGRR